MHSVESVEPENDISLEGWTSCGVSAFVVFRFETAHILYFVTRHSQMRRNSFMLLHSSKQKDRNTASSSKRLLRTLTGGLRSLKIWHVNPPMHPRVHLD